MVRELPFDVTPYRALYPFAPNFFERGGHRIHYVDEGPRDVPGPVVMLHGNPTWSFYWRELIKALSPARRTIVPDHVGCGLSDKPDDAAYDYTLASRVDDLEALLEHAGVRERITLVVHDWGGMIGMAWAVRHPERIERLVVTNTAAFHLPRSKAFPWALGLARSPVGAFLVRAFNMFSFTATYACVTARPLPGLVKRAYRAPYDSWANRIATLRFVEDIPLRPGDRCHALVSQVETSLSVLAGKPMLLVWGERDFVFDNHFRDEWVRRFPQARLISFPQAGHYVLEDATERIVPAVREFVETPA